LHDAQWVCHFCVSDLSDVTQTNGYFAQFQLTHLLSTSLTPKILNQQTIAVLHLVPKHHDHAATPVVHDTDTDTDGDNTNKRNVLEARTIIDQMTSAEFENINELHALARFWKTEDTPEPSSAELTHRKLPKSWFADSGELGLVALNSLGQIEGYLLGCISLRNQHDGVVHACAVLPEARRHGTGTRLHVAFRKLCQERGCKRMSCIVPSCQTGSVAFHRALGFEVSS
jgi:L-amino acid N-acyltransferase YncA